jgi:hypothetical protein
MTEKETSVKIAILIVIMFTHTFISIKACISSINYNWQWTILSFFLIWAPGILLRISIRKKCKIENKTQLWLGTGLSIFSIIIIIGDTILNNKISQVNPYFILWFSLTILILLAWLIWIFKPIQISIFKKIIKF